MATTVSRACVERRFFGNSSNWGKTPIELAFGRLVLMIEASRCQTYPIKFVTPSKNNHTPTALISNRNSVLYFADRKFDSAWALMGVPGVRGYEVFLGSFDVYQGAELHFGLCESVMGSRM